MMVFSGTRFSSASGKTSQRGKFGEKRRKVGRRRLIAFSELERIKRGE
jgi:hypothetical protein